jgi:hypothetical protein
MTPNPAISLTPATDAQTLRWAPCPTCWGQRRIWTREQAANGEGAILRPSACSSCLGIGEVAAA